MAKKDGAIPRKRKKLQVSPDIIKRVDCLESSPSSSSALANASTTGSASPWTQVCGALTVNISDSQAGPSYTPGSSYSSNWAPPFYDWGYQQYFPPMHIVCRLVSMRCTSLEPPSLPPSTALLSGSPMAGDNSPLLQETFQSVLGVATSVSSQLCHHMTFVFGTGSDDLGSRSAAVQVCTSILSCEYCMY